MGQAVAGFSKKELLTSALPAMTSAAGATREDGFIAGLKNAGVTLLRKISEPQPSRWNPDMSLLWIFWKANVISMSYHVQPIP